MSGLPCRICSCLPGEPGLCHAITPTGRACFRVQGHEDWCSACASWSKQTKALLPSNTPIEALAAAHRADLAEAAAVRRGLNAPGSYALRVHAVRMRRKFNALMIEAGIATAPAPRPIKERDRPLCIK